MKALPADLQAHLDSGATTLAWCWRTTRSHGEVLGFTDHDRRLSFAGTDFEPESGFSAFELRASADLAVDAQEAEAVLSSDRITEADILDGRWDNAAVELWRVNWQATGQRVLMRQGAIGQIRRGRTSFVAEIRSRATCSTRRSAAPSSTPATPRSATAVARWRSRTRRSAEQARSPALRDRVFTASGLIGGMPDLQYEVDAYHSGWRCGLEIEAGRAWMGQRGVS